MIEHWWLSLTLLKDLKVQSLSKKKNIYFSVKKKKKQKRKDRLGWMNLMGDKKLWWNLSTPRWIQKLINIYKVLFIILFFIIFFFPTFYKFFFFNLFFSFIDPQSRHDKYFRIKLSMEEKEKEKKKIVRTPTQILFIFFMKPHVLFRVEGGKRVEIKICSKTSASFYFHFHLFLFFRSKSFSLIIYLVVHFYSVFFFFSFLLYL